MIVDSEILTRLPLAAEGVILEKADRRELERRMIEALKIDIPILNVLAASEIVTAEQVVSNQLWLVVLLVPASQPTLEALDMDTARLSNTKFSEEVALARQQMSKVEWRIRQAVGEGCSPVNSTAYGPHQSPTTAIRQRVRSNARGGKIWIPADQFGLEIEVGSVPGYLQRGAEIRIITHVENLDRNSAKLGRVSIEKEARERVKDIPQIASCNKLHRVVDSHHRDWGTRLQLAMDAKSTIELPVVVTLDWATGAAVCFQLSGRLR